MGMTFQATHTYVMNGKQFQGQQTINGGTSLQSEVSIAAAKVGQLTTRTNNTDGTLTMVAGHGFATSDIIDLYWNGGCRVNVTVGTVATNSVPISGGTGDNLPANLTAITAMKPTSIDIAFDATELYAMAFFCDAIGSASFMESTTVHLKWTTLAVSQALGWTNQDATSNPLSTNSVGVIKLSHGDSTSARTARVGVLIAA